MKKVKEIRKAEQCLRKSLGRKPDREEISKHLDKSLSKIDKVLRYGVHEVSLDEPVSDNHEMALADCLEDTDRISSEQRLLDTEMIDGVGEAFEDLTEQQKTVVSYRFGLGGKSCLTLQDTGDQMGLSRERVRQIECQAKDRMRKSLHKRSRIQAASKPNHPAMSIRRVGPLPSVTRTEI
jgi:RNA polymerase sigma factor (sigma-70 family)